MSDVDAGWLIAGVVALNLVVGVMICAAIVIVSRLSRTRIEIRRVKDGF